MKRPRKNSTTIYQTQTRLWFCLRKTIKEEPCYAPTTPRKGYIMTTIKISAKDYSANISDRIREDLARIVDYDILTTLLVNHGLRINDIGASNLDLDKISYEMETTTGLSPRIEEAMLAFLKEVYGIDVVIDPTEF